MQYILVFLVAHFVAHTSFIIYRGAKYHRTTSYGDLFLQLPSVYFAPL